MLAPVLNCVELDDVKKRGRIINGKAFCPIKSVLLFLRMNKKRVKDLYEFPLNKKRGKERKRIRRRSEI